MGTPKQLLQYRGRSLVRHAVETALKSVCSPVYLVAGANAHLLRAEVQDLAIRFVENLLWENGPGTSIRAGVEAVIAEAPQDESDAVMLMLCDQPLVTPEMIDELAGAYEKSQALIVAAEYAGCLGVPALFSRAVFGELLALPPSEGAKRLIAAHARKSEVASIPLAAGAFDVDTPEDYRRLQSSEAQSSRG